MATILQLHQNVVVPNTCVQVQAVVMSAVFDDFDDTFKPDGGTSIPRKGFYISDTGLAVATAGSGIEVTVNTDLPAPTVAPGDAVTVVGKYTVTPFQPLHSTVRISSTCGSVTKTGTATQPRPLAATISDLGQTCPSGTCPSSPPCTPLWTDQTNAPSFEGTLVTIAAGTVNAPKDTHGQFSITDGTVSMFVSDMLGTTASPNINDTVNSITGFAHASFCRRKLRPRSDGDINITAGTVSCGAGAKVDHLLLSEVKTQPETGEYVEIYNPTAAAIDLTNYYLYNATYTPPAASDGGTSDGGTPCRYYNIVNGTQCGNAFNDFSLRFPSGASIGAGEYQVVALNSAANYCQTYDCVDGGTKPNYEIPPPAGCAGLSDDPAVPNMNGSGSVWDTNPAIFCTVDGGAIQGFLTNSSEDMVLFTWDGNASHNVKDVDYFIWGANVGIRTSKTGVGTYAADTDVSSQNPMAGTPGPTKSYQRICNNEGTETKTGGNGITGHDETSENLSSTWVIKDPTPKAATVGAQP
jgi:hypothetical protein